MYKIEVIRTEDSGADINLEYNGETEDLINEEISSLNYFMRELFGEVLADGLEPDDLRVVAKEVAEAHMIAIHDAVETAIKEMDEIEVEITFDDEDDA